MSDKMNEAGLGELSKQVAEFYGESKAKLNGLSGRVNLLLSFGHEITEVAAQIQQQ